MTGVQRPRFSGLPRLTVRGWILSGGGLAAVIVAYSVGWRELLYVGVTLVLLVALSLLVVSARAARLRVSRRIMPDPVSAGDEARVVVEVANDGWLPTGASQWRDGGPHQLGSEVFRPLAPLAVRGWKGDRRSVEYRMRPDSRGRYEVGPLYLRVSDAFGLCLHESPMGGADELLVLPRIVALDGAVSATVALSDSSVRAAMAGRGQDDVIARDYRPGDALRHVHWRATAHRGELMVRQEQRHDDARAIVVLDTVREHWQHAQAFEWAVSFAASTIVHFAASGTGAVLALTLPGPDGRQVWESTGEALLMLSTVTRRSGLRSGGLDGTALRDLQTDGPAPLIVIGGDMAETEWRALAAGRGPNSHAAAVVVDAGGVPETLWAGGWRCASVDDPAADMAAVWRSVTAGAARV